ncbi:hypothetical protein EUGRSUZ_C02734 [Eucalyptus grandis]|uniref:Uncharacterized protein n=2 Tax=Eucalyptus grandis TaxID=71139 RepID=A0ACC3LGS2_EUCGR|nr:hypothetical protein EUGRSUZ_C02734 [Eucalyptus grandis]
MRFVSMTGPVEDQRLPPGAPDHGDWSRLFDQDRNRAPHSPAPITDLLAPTPRVVPSSLFASSRFRMTTTMERGGEINGAGDGRRHRRWKQDDGNMDQTSRLLAKTVPHLKRFQT